MLGELLALSTAVLWALTPVFSKKALEESSPMALNLVRSLSSSTVLWAALLIIRGGFPVNVDPFSLALLSAAAFIGIGLGDLVFFKSMNIIGVSKSVALSSTYPLFTAIISVTFLGESLNLLNILGVLSMVLSIALISMSRESGDNARIESSFKGAILSLTSALIWSIAITLIALSVRKVDVLIGNAFRLSILAVILASILIFRKDFRRGLRKVKVLFWGGMAGVTGLTMGTTMYFESIRIIGATRATALTSTYPILSAIAAVVMLRERPNLRVWAAIALTVIGIFLLETA